MDLKCLDSGFYCIQDMINFDRNIYMMTNRILLLLSLILLTLSCRPEQSVSLPVVNTDFATEITDNSAKSGGNVISDGGTEITAKGVCWNTTGNPALTDFNTNEGQGSGSFTSNLTGLAEGTKYFVKAYATNSSGTSFGDEINFTTLTKSDGQIIADHSVVDRYDDIPAAYLNEVKKMWVSIAGESHSQAYRAGLLLLESLNSAYSVSVVESGTPEPYTTSHLRFSGATWGDKDNSSGWIYSYGEEDWYTNSTAISRTKAGLLYCRNNGPALTALGFGWCWDATWQNDVGGSYDPVYHTRWAGASMGGPEGNLRWGLDAEDKALTGNSVCMDTYINATQSYIDYCAANNIPTKIIWTTGPVDNENNWAIGESGYQQYLKWEYLRNHVRSLSEAYFFDYADILSYNDAGVQATTTWTDNSGTLRTFPIISPENMTSLDPNYHIGTNGAIKLAKAMWWLLARMAGWDGK